MFMGKEKQYQEIEKLILMREWIDDNFPLWYKDYENNFIAKAHSLGLNPYTLKACKREFELRFNINNVEWNLIHILLHFSAMRQAGINARNMENKKVDVEVKTTEIKTRKYIERMVLLMWDILENQDKER